MDLSTKFVAFGGLILAVLGLIYAQVTYWNIRSLPRGNDTQRKLGVTIYNGAMSFIKQEYRYIVIFLSCDFYFITMRSKTPFTKDTK